MTKVLHSGEGDGVKWYRQRYGGCGAQGGYGVQGY